MSLYFLHEVFLNFCFIYGNSIVSQQLKSEIFSFNEYFETVQSISTLTDRYDQNELKLIVKQACVNCNCNSVVISCNLVM